jgi:NAD(P)-dependent dehydrogenase (short-subunit alcohol dehydrogenase family)
VPVAIVTGADSGIGRAAAVALAGDGFDVGITWFEDEEGAGETIAEVQAEGRRAEAREHDLSRLPEAADAIDDLIESLGGVDALVNNAATGRTAAFPELELDDWRYVLAVNLEGAFLCAQRAARRMISQGRGGRIVNVTSVHEHLPLSTETPYVVSKHGLGGLTKQLALELAEQGITVNSVAPGLTATPMTDLEGVDPHTIEKPRIPLGRPADAREIASLIAWLCSAGAAYTTGASLVVDGGFLLTNPSVE